MNTINLFLIFDKFCIGESVTFGQNVRENNFPGENDFGPQRPVPLPEETTQSQDDRLDIESDDEPIITPPPSLQQSFQLMWNSSQNLHPFL